MTQRVKVGVAALMGRIDQKIAAREGQLKEQQARYDADLGKYFTAAEDALQRELEKIRKRMEPEHTSYSRRGHNIVVEVDVEFPEEPDVDNDSELKKMRRHLALLDMAVDPTMMIDVDGEYGRYL